MYGILYVLARLVPGVAQHQGLAQLQCGIPQRTLTSKKDRSPFN